MPLQAEAEVGQLLQVAPDALGVAQRRDRHECAVGCAQAVEQGDVHGWSSASKSRAMSSAGAECVSALTLIRSTPVRAIAAAVSSRTPPEASISTPGAFA